MNGCRLVVMLFADFMSCGTLGHEYSLLTVKHTEDLGRIVCLCERGCGRTAGVSPLMLWNGNAKRCTYPAPAANQSARLSVTFFA